ncbi:MAG TPA: OsmC family protein [Gemmatimonadaceae bacterium]|jgi:organic hydroperoxide reductase OsmC/OhrA
MNIRPKTDERHEYALSLVWTGAAKGPTSSYQSYSREYEYRIGDKAPQRGSADPHFRGDPSLYNPEEMLVIALSTCHLLSYLAECARGGVQVTAYEDSASGVMMMKDGKLRFTAVVLRPRVTIAVGSDIEKATSLHHQAHEDCYIANSVNFPVTNEPMIRVAE